MVGHDHRQPAAADDPSGDSGNLLSNWSSDWNVRSVLTYKGAAIVTANKDMPCSLLWTSGLPRGRSETLPSRAKYALAASISDKPSAGD